MTSLIGGVSDLVTLLLKSVLEQNEPLNWRVLPSIGATKLAFIHSGGIAAALSSSRGLVTGKAPFDPPHGHESSPV